MRVSSHNIRSLGTAGNGDFLMHSLSCRAISLYQANRRVCIALGGPGWERSLLIALRTTTNHQPRRPV